jgi:hypothetical protein
MISPLRFVPVSNVPKLVSRGGKAAEKVVIRLSALMQRDAAGGRFPAELASVEVP